MSGTPNPSFRVPYVGGATPLTLNLNEQLQNVALTFVGFDSSQATVMALPVGADDLKTVTVATAEHTMKILQTPLSQVQISGLAAGTYLVTAFQW